MQNLITQMLEQEGEYKFLPTYAKAELTSKSQTIKTHAFICYDSPYFDYYFNVQYIADVIIFVTFIFVTCITFILY